MHSRVPRSKIMGSIRVWAPVFLTSIGPCILLATQALGIADSGFNSKHVSKSVSVATQSRSAAATASTRTRLTMDDTEGGRKSTDKAAFLGVILPRESTDVGPPVAGKIVSIAVRIGDTVRENDVIARLDARLTNAEFAAAQASASAQRVEYDIAQTSKDTAELQEQRVSALASEGLASGQDLADARSQRRLAELHVTAVEAAIVQKNAEVQRFAEQKSLLEVRAPFTGKIVVRYADLGAIVTPSPLKPIVRLISSDRLFVRFAVPEPQAATVDIGAPVTIRLNTAQHVLSGIIERIAPEVDSGSRTFVAEASLSEPYAGAMAGAVAHVTLGSK